MSAQKGLGSVLQGHSTVYLTLHALLCQLPHPLPNPTNLRVSAAQGCWYRFDLSCKLCGA